MATKTSAPQLTQTALASEEAYVQVSPPRQGPAGVPGGHKPKKAPSREKWESDLSKVCLYSVSQSLTPPPLQLRQELPLSTISQLDTRDIVWCNASKYEGRITPDTVAF